MSEQTAKIINGLLAKAATILLIASALVLAAPVAAAINLLTEGKL
jgi:hypothetical protein